MPNRAALTLSIAVACVTAGKSMVLAQQVWQPIPANAIFETGDTWNVDTQTYRLFGVQACIRGTLVTTNNGIKRDCGDLSLKMLTALVKAWNPLCAVVGFNSSTKYVVCYADIEAAGGRQRIELGTALISSGFAFAAQNTLGGPASISYWAAEQEAERTRAGLWAYPDLPNPNAALLKALKGPVR